MRKLWKQRSGTTPQNRVHVQKKYLYLSYVIVKPLLLWFTVTLLMTVKFMILWNFIMKLWSLLLILVSPEFKLHILYSDKNLPNFSEFYFIYVSLLLRRKNSRYQNIKSIYKTALNALFNPYSPNVTFLYPLKTSENLRFSDVFMGYRNVKKEESESISNNIR